MALLLLSLLSELGGWVVLVFVPDTDPPRNDKQNEQAYYPVDDNLAAIAIDFHLMETRRLSVRHGAGVDMPV